MKPGWRQFMDMFRVSAHLCIRSTRAFRVARRLRAGAALLLLAGCAGQGMRIGAAGPDHAGHVVKPVAMKHYPLPMGDISSGGTAIERNPPVYPKSLLPACPPPVEVQARVDVNRAGRVEQVVGAVIDDAAATPRWHQYFLAAQAAAMRWRFNPLQVTHWAADVDGNSHVVDSANEPFKRFYVFRFACHAGKPVVGVDAVGSP